MSRSSRCLTVAALVALLALLTVLAVPTATPAADRAGKRLVLSPRPGQVVRSNIALLRVSSDTRGETLNVRLNGKEIGRDFGRSRNGARALRASLTFGLRRGRNVLRVTTRRSDGKVRRSTVRFLVRTKRHLVGAGRNRILAVGGRVTVRGKVRPAAGGRPAKLRWKVVHAPRRTRAHRASLGKARRHTLTSPGSRSASFRPRLPGTYRLRLTAGSGPRASSDMVELTVVHRNRLVPIETMTAAGGEGRGIRVGAAKYLLKDAEESGAPGNLPGAPGNFGQLLVLKRDSLEFVANRWFNHGIKQTREYLAGLTPGVYLAILVLQPDVGGEVLNLESATRLIGGPAGQLPARPGTLSVIGVPGMKQGEADVDMVNGGNPLASMEGYLTPDRWGNYGFAPSQSMSFSFGPKPDSPCDQCERYAGFRLRVLDAHSLAPAAHDGEFYKTNGEFNGGPQAEAEAVRMTADLNAIPPDDVVMIEALSTRKQVDAAYLQPVGQMSNSVVAGLAAAVAKAGGTRNAFNRIALKSGSLASGGMTYALVGWQGAGEGAGAEAAADVEGQGDAPSLGGVLRPDRESLFRPLEGDSAPDSLTELVMDKPTNKWPLDDEPGARRALSWLGAQNEKLSSDPRADYVRQPFGEAEWDAVARQVEAVDYNNVPQEQRRFTKEDFKKAREELVKELRWVGNVRAYLTNLGSPVSNSQVLSYAQVKKIGAEVYKDAQEPSNESVLRWTEFTKLILELGGPFTHEVTSTVGTVMQLGVWLFASNENGGEADEVPFKADELGAAIVEKMQLTVETYKRMGDVIVSDSAKLEFVGEHGGCSPDAKGCPPGWSFTDEDITSLKADLQRTVEREAYEELLPLGFSVFGTNLQTLEQPPDLRSYNCGGVHPFSEFSATAEKLATTPLLWELDSNQTENVWKPLVLAKPRGGAFHASTLSDQTLERVFGPVSASNSPGDGGLGVSLARLVPATDWQFWSPTPPYKPTEDACE